MLVNRKSTLLCSESRGQGADGYEAPGIVPADGNAHDTPQISELQQRLTVAEKERDKAKQQLTRYCSMHVPAVCLTQVLMALLQLRSRSCSTI